MSRRKVITKFVAEYAESEEDPEKKQAAIRALETAAADSKNPHSKYAKRALKNLPKE